MPAHIAVRGAPPRPGAGASEVRGGGGRRRLGHRPQGLAMLLVHGGEAVADAPELRTGGVPLIPDGFVWPNCRECGGSMQFLAPLPLDLGAIAVFFCQWCLPAHGPPLAALAGRVEAHQRHVDAFEGGGLRGEVAAGANGLADPRVDALDRVRAADDLAYLDVEGEEGHELGPGVRPQLHDRRILLAPHFLELQEPLRRRVLTGCRVDGLESLGDLVPVLAGRVSERVPQQVNHTRLDNCARPDALHGLGKALEPVTDQHQHVVQAAVLQLGEDVQPVLGALAAVSGPDAEDVAGAVHGHRHHDVDRTVRDLPVPDLDVDGVHEQDRTDALISIDGCERPGRRSFVCLVEEPIASRRHPDSGISRPVVGAQPGTAAQAAPQARGRKRWTMRWKAPLNAFQIAFEGRLTPANN